MRTNRFIPTWVTDSPKLVLHTHLEASLDINVRKLVSARSNIHAIPCLEADHLSLIDFTKDWERFRSVFTGFCNYFTREVDFREAVEHYSCRLAAHHVYYAEIMVSPWKHLSRGVSFEELGNGLIRGAEFGERMGVSIKYLCDITRKSDEPFEAIVRWFRTLPRCYFVGMSFSGGTGSVPRRHYTQLGMQLNNLGIPVTAHAGELEGPRSILDSIEYLGARRIGHGIRALEDDEVLDILLREGIHLEICPTANARMKIGFPDFASIRAIAMTGIPFSINPDDEAIFGTDVQMELTRLFEKGILTEATMERCNSYGITAAFCSEAERIKLRTLHSRCWPNRTLCHAHDGY